MIYPTLHKMRIVWTTFQVTNRCQSKHLELRYNTAPAEALIIAQESIFFWFCLEAAPQPVFPRPGMAAAYYF